jgi:phage gp46-like protein
VTDISITATAPDVYDITVVGGNISGHDGLRTAALMSLLCDREDDSTAERRGYWGDVLDELGSHLGSRFWLLRRERATEQTRTRAIAYANEALGWMLTDQVASRIDVAGTWVRPGWLDLQIVITAPTGPLRLRLALAWQASIDGSIWLPATDVDSAERAASEFEYIYYMDYPQLA